MSFRSGNPTLNAKTFQDITRDNVDGVMTLDGTVNKVGILLSIVIVTAGIVMFALPYSMVMPLMIVGLIGGLISAMVTIFNKKGAAMSAPMYSMFEGMFLGGISVMYSSLYNGIVSQAVILTFGIFFSPN